MNSLFQPIGQQQQQPPMAVTQSSMPMPEQEMPHPVEQAPAMKYSLGDPLIDKYLNMFLGS